MQVENIAAAFGSELVSSESNSIALVYLPEGTHEILAEVNGKPGKRKVIVDDRILASFQSDLAARNADNVRPFVGFDHKEGPAAIIPTAFRYEKGVGLILEGEKTSSGAQAISGRDYSYFSPAFRSKGGIPFGLIPTGEIGSLTNNPAFRDIERIAASYNQTTMDIQPLVDLGLVEASESPETAIETAKASLAALRESAADAETIKAAQTAEAETVKAAQAELETVKASLTAKDTEIETLKASLAKIEDEKIEKIIASHIEAGRIPAKDEKLKKFWSDHIKASGTDEVLAAMPVNPALAKESVIDRKIEEVKAAMARTDFDALSPCDQRKHLSAGGKITD